MKFKCTCSKLAGAIVICLPIAPVLFAASTSSQPEVTLTVNADAMIHTMRGGFGASWHAIEQPIPVEGDRSHGGSAWGANPSAEDTRAWRQIYHHADWLGFDFVRVELEQRMFERLADWRRWSAERGKPLFLSELGTTIYGWRTNSAGPSTWEAAIKDAELVVRALSLGVDGFNRWSFVNRGDLAFGK
jgi:hypothetical protein